MPGLVPIGNLLECALNPFDLDRSPWSTCAITREDIAEAIAARAFIAEHTGVDPIDICRTYQIVPRTAHIRRIAYLVENPAPDPVCVSAAWGMVRLVDGYHRLAAAMYRNDLFVPVTIDGFTRLAAEFLLVPEETLMED